MQNQGVNPSSYGLDNHGIHTTGSIFWNLGTAQLTEHSLMNKESKLAVGGALLCRTGERTGRSPKAKFIVKDEFTADRVWWGNNQPCTPEAFEVLFEMVQKHFSDKNIYVQDCFVGADEAFRVPIRICNEFAWHNLFGRQLFVRPDWTKTGSHVPEWVLHYAPTCKAPADMEGTDGKGVFVVVNFTKKVVIIGGSAYAGEMKKAIFSVMNMILPMKGVLPMHCSANKGAAGDTALYFGLSGTGKTTLSADPNRSLIGDDEHGWSDKGTFNFEGGCYAKVIKLSEENEPQIWNAIRFGTIVENVVYDSATRLMDFDDVAITENTRAGYPLSFIDNALIPSIGGHPKNIFFLTCDAFGVLPPVAKLSIEQAKQQYVLGYTSRVAGTEAGVTDPAPTFSACFGAPFLPLAPKVYADLLGKKLDEYQSDVWLINTGWSGGPYGVGSRMKIPYTRAMITAALDGSLAKVKFIEDPHFGIAVPTECPGVPAEILNPRNTWADKEAYDAQAAKVAGMWDEQFKKLGLR
ncbi:MAG: phosphoenolpyruvate carboxykinase (ATP) [Armatimonadota bacterium]